MKSRVVLHGLVSYMVRHNTSTCCADKTHEALLAMVKNKNCSRLLMASA